MKAEFPILKLTALSICEALVSDQNQFKFKSLVNNNLPMTRCGSEIARSNDVVAPVSHGSAE